MRYILMNKNKEVMLIEYSKKYNVIKKICKIYNIKYAPLTVLNSDNDILENLNKWYLNRKIPSWRKDLSRLLDCLGVSSSEELLNKSYGLSLSDQYWLKNETSPIKWQDINFFTNDFEYEAYLQASLDSSNSSKRTTDKEILRSPNNTTDGMLQKGWIIENNKRVLVKGTYTFSREEPFNEYLASQISKCLNFDYCNYTVSWSDKTKLVSMCENFINEDEEIISAYDIFKSEVKPNNINDYEFYISILEKHNVPKARESLENLFILDYLMMNTDRHLKNFGVIRNVNTLEWVKTTPIFDTGEAMQCDEYTDEINFSNGKGKFFTNTSKDYEDILKTLGPGIIRVDVKALDNVVEVYKDILKKYQSKLDISDMRINKLTDGLTLRIKKLKNAIEKQKENR